MPNTVIAIVDRALLSTALTQFHRNGFGHVIKVMDGARAPILDQLRRAGLNQRLQLTTLESHQVLLFVPAPERTQQAALLAHSVGATAIEMADCGEVLSWSLPVSLQNEVHRRASRRRPPMTLAPMDLSD
ncbi:MAG TPA: hypothetical protein PK819_02780 [Thermomicrobiales bacterium]|nr:hypothetical protein [Thermomicrobiales bacterium]